MCSCACGGRGCSQGASVQWDGRCPRRECPLSGSAGGRAGGRASAPSPPLRLLRVCPVTSGTETAPPTPRPRFCLHPTTRAPPARRPACRRAAPAATWAPAPRARGSAGGAPPACAASAARVNFAPLSAGTISGGRGVRRQGSARLLLVLARHVAAVRGKVCAQPHAAGGAGLRGGRRGAPVVGWGWGGRGGGGWASSLAIQAVVANVRQAGLRRSRLRPTAVQQRRECPMRVVETRALFCGDGERSCGLRGCRPRGRPSPRPLPATAPHTTRHTAARLHAPLPPPPPLRAAAAAPHARPNLRLARAPRGAPTDASGAGGASVLRPPPHPRPP